MAKGRIPGYVLLGDVKAYEKWLATRLVPARATPKHEPLYSDWEYRMIEQFYAERKEAA